MNGYDWVRKYNDNKKADPKAQYSGPPFAKWVLEGRASPFDQGKGNTPYGRYDENTNDDSWMKTAEAFEIYRQAADEIGQDFAAGRDPFVGSRRFEGITQDPLAHLTRETAKSVTARKNVYPELQIQNQAQAPAAAKLWQGDAGAFYGRENAGI